MKQVLGVAGAIIGVLVAVFYAGTLASNTYVANRSFESPEDVMLHHSGIYLATIVVCLFAGLIIGRLIGRIFCKS